MCNIVPNRCYTPTSSHPLLLLLLLLPVLYSYSCSYNDDYYNYSYFVIAGGAVAIVVVVMVMCVSWALPSRGRRHRLYGRCRRHRSPRPRSSSLVRILARRRRLKNVVILLACLLQFLLLQR